MRGAAALLVAVLALGLAAPALQAAPSQDEGPTTSTGTPEDRDIIPEPNSGSQPGEAGDRGGALQLAVLGVLVVAVGGGVFAVIRESRRKRTGLADRAG